MQGMNPYASGIVAALANQPKLLMKMRILSLGKNYDVMDPNQRVLCQVGLDASQNMTGAAVTSVVSQVAGGYIGRWAGRSLAYTYLVRDANGTVALAINKGSGGNKAEFQVVDVVTGTSFGRIELKRSLIGGLKATWFGSDGQPWLNTKGNIIRRKYAILGPDGREVGRVRHKILAIRDVWELEFESGANHLFSAIFATILDFEKKM
ncbi:MAG: hypothetical protein L3K02_06465 [Thermoplasmata archaeon]|nr:hypothetical protein [Thermoplasmata archaeon]